MNQNFEAEQRNNEHYYSEAKGCKITYRIDKKYTNTGRVKSSVRCGHCETHNVDICYCGWEWEWHYGTYSGNMQ